MSNEELKNKFSREIAGGLGISFVGKIIMKMIGFPIKILLARSLGPSGLGIYQLGINILRWLTQFSKLGLNKASIRFISEYEGNSSPEKLKGFLLVSLSLPTFVGIVITLIVSYNTGLITSIFSNTDIEPYLELFLILLPIIVMDKITDASLRGFKKIDQKIGVRLTQIVFNIIGLSFVVIRDYGLHGAISALIISYSVSTTLSLYFIWKNYNQFPSINNIKFEFRKWTNFASPTYISDFVYTTTRSLDILILGVFMTSSDIGVYTIAFSLSTLLSFPLTAVNQIFPSIISDLYTKDRMKTVEDLYQLSTRWIYILSAPMFLSLFIYSKQFILLIFGQEYTGAVMTLRILLLSEVFNFGFGSVGFMLQMTDRQYLNLAADSVSAITNLALNLALIPVYGIEGAASATAASLAINNFSGYLFLYSKSRIAVWNKQTAKILCPVIVFLLVSYFGQVLDWYVSLSTCIFFYIIATWSISLDDTDKSIIYSILKSVG